MYYVVPNGASPVAALAIPQPLAPARVHGHDADRSLKAARAAMKNRLKAESGALPESRPARARNPLHRLKKLASLPRSRIKRTSWRE